MQHIPRKSLGQNFLIDQTVVDQIVAAAQLTVQDVVLEVGPGKGVLTEALAMHGGKVLAMEVDQTLIPVLENRFKERQNVEIIHEDILKADVKKIITDYKLRITGYRVIANLPYYITSPIIRLFLEADCPPKEMIVMVQKEVAERICAKPGEMSILAVSVQYYAEPEILFYVPRTAFDPIPEVDSAVIKIAKHKTQHANNEEVKNFFRVVRAGFCAKRKTLANNLANSFRLERIAVEEKLARVGISPKARAQEIDVDSWKQLAQQFSLQAD